MFKNGANSFVPRTYPCHVTGQKGRSPNPCVNIDKERLATIAFNGQGNTKTKRANTHSDKDKVMA